MSSPDRLVAEYLLAARADNTRRAYDSDLRHFQAWGGCLPSNPDEVARYITHHAGVLQPVTLRRRLAAIATVDKDLGLGDPTKHALVLRVIQSIEPRHGHLFINTLAEDDLRRSNALVGPEKETSPLRSTYT